jgi:hypothetical protein
MRSDDDNRHDPYAADEQRPAEVVVNTLPRERARAFHAHPLPRSLLMSRLDVTEKIVATKVAKGIKWSEVAAKVGLSKEWVTAACLGQMTLTPEQAGVIGTFFGLSDVEQKWLQVVPDKGSLPHLRADRPADLSLLRAGECVRQHLQGTDP